MRSRLGATTGATYTGAGAAAGGAAMTAGRGATWGGGAIATDAGARGGTYCATTGPHWFGGGGGPNWLCQHSPKPFNQTCVREPSTQVSRSSGGPKFCACAGPAAKPSTRAQGTTMRNEALMISSFNIATFVPPFLAASIHPTDSKSGKILAVAASTLLPLYGAHSAVTHTERN